MKLMLVAFITGFLFALGLGISGMTDANKIIGFLDVSDRWDPTLAFVLLGAIAVHFVGYRLVIRRPSPILAKEFHLPKRHVIDTKLLVGAAIFGVGWGWSGYCPGPGIVASIAGYPAALLFVGAMLLGMFIFQIFDRLKK